MHKPSPPKLAEMMIVLLSMLIACLVMVLTGIPEPPASIGKGMLLFLLWIGCVLIWGMLFAIADIISSRRSR